MLAVLLAHWAKAELVNPREVLIVATGGAIGGFIAGWFKSKASS
jgi:uncharacterized membrane protein YfcA